MSRLRTLALCAWVAVGSACGEADERPVLTFSGSEVGAEGEVLRAQLRRFEASRPGVRVELRATPDAADQRHQLYAQWLNARTGEPDVLQLDVIWTAELAAAGWLLPLDERRIDADAWFPRVLEAGRYEGRLFGLPWFVDVGMLYWRTDLVPRPPQSFDELQRMAAAAVRSGRVRHGYVWPGARYEGLATTWLEALGGHGGRLFDEEGRAAFASPEGRAALGFLRGLVADGVTPVAALAWQEEQTRFAFQRGEAAFMRNWPYAYPLLQDPARSSVAGRFAVAPLPAQGGRSTSALGGAQLAVNGASRHPELARDLVEFLARPEQMLERARRAGQLPARRALYEGEAARALPLPADAALQILETATPRPANPAYSELSEALQIGLHRALSGQQAPEAALAESAQAVDALSRSLGLLPGAPVRAVGTWALVLGAAALAAAVLLAAARRRRGRGRGGQLAREERLAWGLALPAALTMALVVLFPLAWTAWESLHLHDLRMPWRGRPFVGVANYLELFGLPRFREGLLHTLFFMAATLAVEIPVGLALALALNRAFRGRGAVRASVLLPWTMPTVVAAVIWRFLFDAQAGLASALVASAGLSERGFVWFVDPAAAWVPVLLADAWKTTPFVALLLLAGLQAIPPSLYEAARVDGAGAWRQLRYVTLPLLRPALGVAVLFRALDALRVFDLVYVLTGGGPGTATEPISMTTYAALLQSLRFGLGSALSVVVFGLAALLAVAFVRGLGAAGQGEER